ncbi:serine/threonine-protein kinase PLK1-like [Sycon ciliatum]|uniref:serine/threonine-protein kinase PLK1-like n=1 Tax=Sycon ciliatum TaxID=27933 RepID=UPI0020AB4C5D|eukprot:scpid52521/ scgid7616/ Serine/threonine-protein kinase PLK1; Polo-like kinase 1; Serine/threonine-protein kinase 13
MATSQPEGTIIVDSRTKRKYRQGRFLGRGGFAKCYELTDQETNQVYAGKIVDKTSLTKQHHRDKLTMEIKVHRSVKHQHIVDFVDCFEDSNNVYIILELCRSKSMKELHKRRKTLTEPETRYFMKQIISALVYLHEQKIIHRDVKLGNLFLNEDLEIKMGDFGLATVLDYDGEKKKTVCGTPNYTAPEIITKKGHSFEVDVWSLGCIMYTLLIGNPPFVGTTLREVFSRIRKNDFHVPPRQISEEAQALIVRLLHPDPSHRPKPVEILSDPFFTTGTCPKRLPVTVLSIAPRFTSASSSTVHSGAASSRHPLAERNTSVPTRQGTVATKAIPTPASAATAEPPLDDIAAEPSPMDHLNELSAQLEKVIATKPGTKPIRFHDDAEDPAANPVYWIGKWVDYSDKYGFGYSLCDGSSGVLFNDGSRMMMAADSINVQYLEGKKAEAFFTAEDYPSSLQKKMTLLKYFRSYMTQHLLRAGGSRAPDRYENGRLPMLQTWFRTKNAIVLQLSNGILQINFFKDHNKIILCPRMQAVTYIDEERHFRTFPFHLIEACGCSETLAEHMAYAHTTVVRMLTDGIKKAPVAKKQSSGPSMATSTEPTVAGSTMA